MSILVALPETLYANDAARNFNPALGTDTRNARLMAWLAQLAYDADDADKLSRVLTRWGLTLRHTLFGTSNSRLPLASTRGFIATTADDSAILAFQGTDPLVAANWASDFNTAMGADNVSVGFTEALEVVWPDLVTHLTPLLPNNNTSLFITGHSLGGALAVLAAARIAGTFNPRTVSVFTYGMPRVGGETFARHYEQLGLNATTLRLVYGQDLVPTVPSHDVLGYRHIGRRWSTARGSRFNAGNVSGVDNEPEVAGRLNSWAAGLLHAIPGQAAAGPPPATTTRRTDATGLLIETLPGPIRDHLPDCYWGALS